MTSGVRTPRRRMGCCANSAALRSTTRAVQPGFSTSVAVHAAIFVLQVRSSWFEVHSFLCRTDANESFFSTADFASFNYELRTTNFLLFFPLLSTSRFLNAGCDLLLPHPR